METTGLTSVSKNPAVNAGDEKQHKEAERKSQWKKKYEREDWTWLLSDIRGRRIVRILLEKTNTFGVSFGSGNDSTNYNEGRRSVGVQILKNLNAYKPSAYVQMLEEKEKEL